MVNSRNADFQVAQSFKPRLTVLKTKFDTQRARSACWNAKRVALPERKRELPHHCDRGKTKLGSCKTNRSREDVRDEDSRNTSQKGEQHTWETRKRVSWRGMTGMLVWRNLMANRQGQSDFGHVNRGNQQQRPEQRRK